MWLKCPLEYEKHYLKRKGKWLTHFNILTLEFGIKYAPSEQFLNDVEWIY